MSLAASPSFKSILCGSVKNSLVLSGVDVITYGRVFDTQDSDACEIFEHKGDESSILKDSESSIEGDAWQR